MFDYSKALQTLLTPEIVATISAIHEYRGRQVRLSRVAPATLDKLCNIAKIQSTGASNRIENISTSESRLRALMEEKVEPHNRDEQEILGYRYVLDMIHENHDAIPVTPNVILQLHRDLYRYLDYSFAGRWKDSDNIIQEIGEDGKPRTRFVPTSAAATPGAVEELCGVYRSSLHEGVYDPLLIISLFIFDFVSIHPFSDGNGRMSRLLTLLLLYQNKYTVGKYISIEHEIERTKRSYYEALKASSDGWREGMCDYRPFVSYLLGVILACYRDFDQRSQLVDMPSSNEEKVRLYFEHAIRGISKRDLLQEVPGMSEQTMTRILQQLQQEGLIERVGAARATTYRKKITPDS